MACKAAALSAPPQAKELLVRNWQQYARKYDYNVTRILITLVIGICFGTLFQDQVRDMHAHTPLSPLCGSSVLRVLTGWLAHDDVILSKPCPSPVLANF